MASLFSGGGGVRLSEAKLGTEVFVCSCSYALFLAHGCHHMGWFNGSILYGQFIRCVDSVNEFPIPRVVRIIVVAERPINKNVNDVPKGNEEIKIEIPH